MSCPNFLLDEDEQPTERPCGDEGEMCVACWKREAESWAAYFGLRPGMTREERLAQLKSMRPDLGGPTPEERDALMDAGRG